MAALSLLLAAAAYGAFYAAAPGRQSAPAGPPRPLRWAGAGLAAAALALSVAAYGPGVGPVLVVTVMMTVASVLAVAGPFLLPEVARPARGTRPARGARPARPAPLNR
ncbi:hypothetical protein RQM47_00835 [Rubrivirga sp. S365]|uniref:Uncharacterized protein n=1 Tax=Rubrivirga litoralis TaxID=3075598 RepID=A0ABU3BU66_9BACT|nr:MULTISPECIES: hypothetical protein [unclassified Rubrivirga]MDT0632780.1 hypothetical protein [Rubrivirga sp. F394]MDT7855180.1 hypothetical protein [Rubrivirga sp. S365]